MISKFTDRKQMYILEIMYRYMSIPIVKKLAGTAITPNMVTITNMIIAVINSYLLFYNKYNIISAFLLFIYCLLDGIDGNLARYTGKTSKIGAQLDKIGDYIFYNVFLIAIGINKVSPVTLFMALILHNGHGIIATNYIVPNIRKIKEFKRVGIKNYLMNKGIILGVDISFFSFLLIVALISRKYVLIYILIIVLYAFDISYRLIELWANQYVDNKKKE